jgi:hypothetical protein
MLSAISRVRSVLKGALLPGLAFVVLTAGTPVAQATTLNDTFNISIYQGYGGGNIASAASQAVITNPLITGADASCPCFVESGTYTGALDFNDNGTNTIGAFLANGGGFDSFSGATKALALSAGGFAATTVFVITGTVSGEILAGTIHHDDGITLYDSTLAAIASSASPTVDIATGYGGLTGDWTLVYVASNNIPEILRFDVASSQEIITPLPASVWLFGSVLAGSGLFVGRRRKRKSASAA